MAVFRAPWIDFDDFRCVGKLLVHIFRFYFFGVNADVDFWQRVSNRDTVRFRPLVQPAVLRKRHRESRTCLTYLQPSYAVTEVCISSRWEIDGSLLLVQSRLHVGGIACFFVARVRANRW